MSDQSNEMIAYQDAPAPLSDRERETLKRVFSDFFEVPGEWKTGLVAWLEANPPILGKSTLGGQVPSLAPNSVLSIHIVDGTIIEQDLSAALQALINPQIVTGWGSDNLPLVTGNGPVVRVPYVAGVATTFTLKRAFARVENPGGSSTVFRVEKSSAAGAFTPTTVETLTIGGGAYSVEDASPALVTVTSGDELRVVYVSLGTTGPYQVQLQWEG